MASEIDKMKDNAKTYKAAKAMKRRSFENPYVTDSTDKRITNPQTMYETIKQHFNDHFHDTNIADIEQFMGKPRQLDKPITEPGVTASVKKLNNNRPPGSDMISAELVKYAPHEVHKQIAEILNDSIQKH